MKRLARRAYMHMYGGWIEIARFQFNYVIYNRERGVQENRAFLNTTCTLMYERVSVCVCENINNKINKLKIIINNFDCGRHHIFPPLRESWVWSLRLLVESTRAAEMWVCCIPGGLGLLALSLNPLGLEGTSGDKDKRNAKQAATTNWYTATNWYKVTIWYNATNRRNACHLT